MDKRVVLVGALALGLLVIIGVVGWQTGLVVQDTDGQGGLKTLGDDSEDISIGQDGDDESRDEGVEYEGDNEVSYSGGSGGSSSSGGGSSCSNECYAGEKRCSEEERQVCGNYDQDSCLEWGEGEVCENGCENGECRANYDVELTIGSKNVSVGERFKIDVNINASGEVFASDLILEYDSSLLKGINVTKGGFLESDGERIYVGEDSIDNESEEIRYAVTRIGTQEGVEGEGVLSQITFEAINNGKINLKINETNVINAEQKVIPVATFSGEVNVL